MVQPVAAEAALPLTRLDNADPDLLQELLETVARVAEDAAFTGGREVAEFESEFATYCATRHAIGVSSGTEALALVLRAFHVGPGDEVIVPANSFIATAEAVSLVGATPRLVDVDPETGLITAAHVEAAISPLTRCVIPVHLYGRTVDLGPIVELATDRGILVVEDACQAHGAFVGERRAGAIGAAGCFSFYPTKNLGGWGDGGAVITDDDLLATRVRLLRSHGEEPRYHHHMPGTTARLDALQAAVLRVKLARLDEVNDERRRVGQELTDALRAHGAYLQVPAAVTGGGDHVFHQFVVRTDLREALREHLAAQGIATAVHYPTPIHLTSAYASLGMLPGSLPVVERLAPQILSLPIYPGMRDEEIERIATAVEHFGGVAAAA